MTPPELSHLLDQLVTPEAIYFPLRHHSPVCARHLEQALRDRRPRAVLVEGPADFTPLIPQLLDARTLPPVAIYTSFAPPPGAETPKPSGAFAPIRRAAYYPFAANSPELVALRLGHELGATLQFIDLPFPAQIESQPDHDESPPDRVESLLAEESLARSQYLARLARRTGCRDHNDLWDHLFETQLEQPGRWMDFVREVAAWCWLARSDRSMDSLKADGTLAREAAMANAIRRELQTPQSAGAGPVLVVTGGFHTVALPALVALPTGGLATPPSPSPHRQRGAARGVGGRRPEEGAPSTTCLVRYSFEQLDALNGYASGMPAPYYYERLWQGASSAAAGESTFDAVAARMLVELGQLSRRRRNASAVSTADLIAALHQARQLAALRGHPGPTREDLLDGIRSGCIKGAMDAEGARMLDLAHHLLSGNRIGEVPPDAGRPPLVEDFHRRAAALRLKTSDSLRHPSALDLYRKALHRMTSRFFHCVVELEVPLARLESGPDFVRGTGLERLIEHWSWQWSPQTESQLVEAGRYGSTVEEAATGKLLRAVGQLEEQGRGRNASEAVSLLVRACRMGLHDHVGRLLGVISAHLSADPNFVSLVGALQQLVLLWESREPLEAHRLTTLPALIRTALRRAVDLLPNQAATPEKVAEEVLTALIQLREMIARLETKAADAPDPELFWSALAGFLRQSGTNALLAGGAAGMLHREGRLSETDLFAALTGFLAGATGSVAARIAFLVGLLRTARELAWQAPELSKTVERLLSTWSEDEFCQVLPHLRLAFADLTPQETDQVAARVAEIHGRPPLPRLNRPDLFAKDLLLSGRLTAAVTAALRRDGLEDWL